MNIFLQNITYFLRNILQEILCGSSVRPAGQTDGRPAEQTDGQTDGRTGRRTAGQTANITVNFYNIFCNVYISACIRAKICGKYFGNFSAAQILSKKFTEIFAVRNFFFAKNAEKVNLLYGLLLALV